MNPRERIKKTLSHNQPDKLPVDFDGTHVTGIQASIVYKLRQWYGLDKTSAPVKVVEPYQMLGEIKDDLKEVLGADCTPLWGRTQADNGLFQELIISGCLCTPGISYKDQKRDLDLISRARKVVIKEHEKIT